MRLDSRNKARGEWRPDLGFEVWARCGPAIDQGTRESLADRFVEEAIEANNLVCGAGVFGPGARGGELRVVVMKEREYTSCTNRDRSRVERWLRSERAIAEHRVGPLTPTDRDGDRLGPSAPLPRAPGKTEAERANWLRAEAIAAYREAVEILARPSIRDAAEKLERSAELAEAAVDEVAYALVRKLRLSKDRKQAPNRMWDLRYFLEYSLDEASRPSHQRGVLTAWLKTPLSQSLRQVEYLDRPEVGVIDIPDAHEFERKLVWGTRVAIEELGKLLDIPRSSAAGRRLARAAANWREMDAKHQSAKEKKPEWPKHRAAVFTAAKSIRVQATLGEDDVARTIIPERLAKACGAAMLPAEIPVFLPRRDEDGHTDWNRSMWIAAHPALLWVSVPGTSWKAPVLAAVVATARCPVPRVGKDWLDDAVFRRHERKDQDE